MWDDTMVVDGIRGRRAIVVMRVVVARVDAMLEGTVETKIQMDTRRQNLSCR